MDKQTNEILCGDCNENYISKERFEKYGVCLSCQRRKTIAKTNNFKYIPYKDLPQSEKDRLAKQREVNNRWAKNKKKQKLNKDKVDKCLTKSDELPAEFLVSKFIHKYKYDSLSFVAVKGYDIYNKFKKYCESEKYILIDNKVFYDILKTEYYFKEAKYNLELYYYRGGTDKDFLNYMEDTSKIVTTTRRRLRSNQVYSPEIIDEIKAVASDKLTTSQLRQIFVNKYPELNITVANFNNIMVRHKIPHAGRYGSNVEETIIVNPAKVNKKVVEEDVVEDDIQFDTSSLQEIQDVTQEEHIIEKEVDEDGDPIRLVPIKEEVVSILDERFAKENAKNKFNYTVDDYINMLEMFEYLSANIDGLIRCRDKQFNIVNNYQFDIIHEMENELAEEGNTYLQDKMYVMRDYRRYMEVDYKALKQLRPVLKLIKTVLHPNNPNNTSDLKSISGCINSLKQIISENAQPKFVPRVDVGMTKKYDWAINKNSVYKKAVAQKPNIIQTVVNDNGVEVYKEDYDLGKELAEVDKKLNDDKSMGKGVQVQDKNIKINASLKNLKSNVTLSDEEIKKGFAVYRVSCRISGGGFGVFRPWYKDYACIKEEMAMAFAQQEFAKMKAQNGQLLFSEVECRKLNVV